MPHAGFHIALVGASSLKGKEVKEVLERRSFAIRHLTLLDEEERQGQLAEFQGEPTFIRSVWMRGALSRWILPFSQVRLPSCGTAGNWPRAKVAG